MAENTKKKSLHYDWIRKIDQLCDCW